MSTRELGSAAGAVAAWRVTVACGISCRAADWSWAGGEALELAPSTVGAASCWRRAGSASLPSKVCGDSWFRLPMASTPGEVCAKRSVDEADDASRAAPSC